VLAELIVGRDAAYHVKLLVSVASFAVAAGLLAAVVWLLRDRLTPARVSRWFRAGFTVLLYVIVASLVVGTFAARWGFRGDSPHWGLEKMLAFKAERPFAYRVLSPAIVNTGIAMLPDGYVAGREEWLTTKTPLLRYRHRNESWTLEKSVAWHVAYLYIFASLLIALYAARAVTTVAGPPSPLLVDIAPAVALLFLPLTFQFGGYLYDFPELALLFLCLLAALRERWWLYYAAFVAAVLNKESNALILVYFVAVAWDRMDRRALLRHVAVQLVIGATIVIGLRTVFAENGGGSTQFWFPLNVLFWLQPETYLRFDSPYAPVIPVPRTANLFSLFLLFVLVKTGWKYCPPTVRRLGLFSAVVNVPLFLVWGFLDEVRALSLTFPALYLLACHAVPALWSSSDGTNTT
jgi:hypothetical protein